MSPKVSENYKYEKRKELLNSARNVFIKNGYLRTSMQDIMDEAKISRGALYSYFKNIDDVFLEVLKLDDCKDIESLDFRDNESIWNQLMIWIEDILDDICEVDKTLTFAKTEFFIAVNYKADKDKFTYIKDRHNRLEKKIENIIEVGIERKEFYPQICINSIAIYFISFFDGLMLNRFNLDMDRGKLEKQVNIFKYSLEKILWIKK
ncbi:TetR/AcrR family transcriptional regulator [Clostridium botulinum]|uniref:TetR/AcrR family transcriptional regulator n=1 Tax=Clostridium botulinum TaxID=1491 RepID=A0A846JAQ9_CLOBO|nr:TetR family transcriptional regulator [Clostridium botulinum]ACA56685.1 transcriptional regulator, TetR family [Clostridium botulinum A3 str. Loch Maree]NFH64296.1 TetR/AcrR family transcriptional regulator [Clostridium botulinum]NFJ07125.1 TetR/AcrR family transcriptional regulator [Clostridium botulinum]NFK14097.1 TetR/AcrR family transcriptional regulator [Clostridium botulinum]NFM92247.1 TetR/AcrR family transcriptional regulator [Clostridium botulinum]